jgi:hypothetical protein
LSFHFHLPAPSPIRPSATRPRATQQKADADRNQYGLDWQPPNEVSHGVLCVAHLFASLFAAFRGVLAQLSELLLGSVPYGPAHFLKVFRHFFRLFAKLITCGKHGSSLLVMSHEIARRGTTSED